MKVNTSKFITKSPVETEYGIFRFLTIEEYIDYQESLSLISLGTLNLYYSYKQILKNPTQEEKDFLKVFKDTPLRQVVLQDMSLLNKYLELIDRIIVFKEDFDIGHVFSTDEIFMDMRKIIMDMNSVKEEKAFYNEELQVGLDRKKKMQLSKSGESVTIEDIITCLATMTTNSLEQVMNMTVYQAQAMYQRIAVIEDYKANVIFATVDNDRKVESWSKHIDMFKEDSKDGITRSQFEANMGGF